VPQLCQELTPPYLAAVFAAPFREDILDQVDFDHDVRDALANLYDPIHLQSHPLLAKLTLSLKVGETAGESLRRLLWETMESLRPTTPISQSRPEWLNYRLLWMYYAQSSDQGMICQELGLSRRSFYRHLAKATKAISNILWNQYRRIVEIDMTQTNSSDNRPPAKRASEEAVRLALRSPWQPVDLDATLDAACDTVLPLAKQQGIQLAIHRPNTLPPACGDPAMFHQIILSVLTSGIKLAQRESLRLDVHVEAQETVWQLVGLDELRAPERNLGNVSGIALSQALIEAYSGRLWIEHDAQRQPILCFAIPTASRTVLIIEDDQDAIGLYRRYLQRNGYVVYAARQAEEIAAWLTEDGEYGILPDLILLDVLMPQQDGWSVLQEFKAEPHTRDIPVLVCSVLDEPHLALALGAAAVLQKPFSEEGLLQAVQQALKQQGNQG